jgi:hypothetical protein
MTDTTQMAPTETWSSWFRNPVAVGAVIAFVLSLGLNFALYLNSRSEVELKASEVKLGEIRLKHETAKMEADLTRMNGQQFVFNELMAERANAKKRIRELVLDVKSSEQHGDFDGAKRSANSIQVFEKRLDDLERLLIAK